MIVCQCKAISTATIFSAVDAGAGSLGQVCRSTGAGTDCGCCVFALKDLVCDYQNRLALLPITGMDLLVEAHDEAGFPASRRAS